MFYRSSSRRNQKGGSDLPQFGSPSEELTHNLDRLESLANKIQKANAELHRPVPETPASRPRRNLVSSLKKLRRKQDDDDIVMPSITVTPTKEDRIQRRNSRKEPDANFVHVDAEDEAEMIECIRRIAEMVVIGERSAAAAADRREQAQKISREQKEGKETDQVDKPKSLPLETEKYVALFEQFFERNGLALIVGIATGVYFSFSPNTTPGQDMNNSYSSNDLNSELEADESVWMFLPPVAIATQAVQSVSILVQNVSRATSLYFILSNNHINQLIKFPLENYQAADCKMKDLEVTSPRRHGSPELAELTTHFITFLKSLALRMNVETLQFFLTYPPDENLRDQPGKIPFTKGNVDASEEGIDFDGVDRVPVNFPLYARALEFCSAHQDSFVRLTAMNICLNTLRIATVAINPGAIDAAATFDTASPDGVLHNAKALPIRERLSIAQHVCAPSRVELLVSPIFTKLAQLWGMLEERFRELDSLNSLDKSDIDGANEKRRRLIAKFNDIAANLQDELLLFEDVLKVGLTSLNEQAIEMMLATFVYPLLLQPLLLYFQRSQVSEEILFADQLDNYKAGSSPESSESEKAFISAPAKSSLFSLSTIFLFITHQPLLRMIFGALFHPLAPDVIGETVVKSKPDVAFIEHGNIVIRIDPSSEKDTQENSKFQLNYLFGVRPGTTPVPAKDASFSRENDSDEICVFVLSPALAEILTADSVGEGNLLSRTRLNPYRKAIFQCLGLSYELSDMRPLAALAIDTTVSVFDRRFVSDTLFGQQLPDLVDNFSELSHTTLVDEVVDSFRRSIATVVPGSSENWMLNYDQIAAHALLCSVVGHKGATSTASAKINERCCQAAAFLSDVPSNKGLSFDVGLGLKSASQEEKQTNFSMDQMFRGSEKEKGPSAVDELKVMKPEHRGKVDATHNIVVSKQSTFNELCRRASRASTAHDEGKDAKGCAINSARSWLRLDAFSNLLSILVTSEKEWELAGIAVQKGGEVTQTGERLSIYAPISAGCDSILFENESEERDPQPGSIESLVGHTSIPCVCEAPASCASLFSAEGARVIADGVTWQSLYLVLFGRYMILAEPERSRTPGGDGRVVMCCLLERLTVEKDDLLPDGGESYARRLLITYEGSENSPMPGLFIHNEANRATKNIFYPASQFYSTLDCWFEDELAATHAFDVLQNRIKMSRARRGKRIRKYLAQGKT